MKILGIGNAIVDVICKVDNDFLQKNSLTKSTMKLVDEFEFQKLIIKFKNRGNNCWRISCKLNCWSFTTWKQSGFYW